jgi:hypothetical protein
MQPNNAACTCKHTEAQAMLKHGAPLSVVARTLKLKISDILRLENTKAAK